MNPATRWRCRECGKTCEAADMLRAPHPWIDDSYIHGCPSCREPGNLHLCPLCDEPGCEADASCGWPSPSGYRQTCGQHYREGEQ